MTKLQSDDRAALWNNLIIITAQAGKDMGWFGFGQDETHWDGHDKWEPKFVSFDTPEGQTILVRFSANPYGQRELKLELLLNPQEKAYPKHPEAQWKRTQGDVWVRGTVAREYKEPIVTGEVEIRINKLSSYAYNLSKHDLEFI